MKSSENKLKKIIEDSEESGPGKDIWPKAESLNLEETEKNLATAGLQMISLRLPASVIETLKKLAGKEGLKYQPYIRRQLIKLATDASNPAAPMTEERVREIIKEEREKYEKEAS